MDAEQFASMKRYVGFDERCAERLRDFHPRVQPHAERVVDDFYEAIRRDPRAAAVITGGDEQIDRLKRTLVSWLSSVLLGPHDAAYLEAHSRIGRVHVRIDLAQDFMFTAMSRMRARLTEIAEELPAAERRGVLDAVHRVLDLELAIMLDSYRDDADSRLRASERLATIGQLAASIGHELRNPLGTIESSLFLMRRRLDKLGVEDESVLKHHGKISKQVQVCGKTITDLLELARSRAPHKQTVPVRRVVDDAVEASAVPDSVRVEVSVQPDVTMSADPDQLRQVFTNLIVNAVEAQPDGGFVRVEAAMEPGGTAIEVIDGGPGVPPDQRNRVFDALVTSKARGTGLGLALCRRITRAHGGEVDLVPTTTGGRFRVWLPDPSPTGP